MIKKKFGIGILILAMLLVSITLVPAASAKAEKTDENNSFDSEVETFVCKKQQNIMQVWQII
ncbi:hypothetical protein [Methanosarcina horonobensis]|uniref:hypothetical protein n=1 Tax=Methanosarcina horonobensis TaxID=418008 RepID=UPI00064EEBB0|nr:hypothetical protein [Methanosarcina horonobensis]